MKFNMQT